MIRRLFTTLTLAASLLLYGFYIAVAVLMPAYWQLGHGLRPALSGALFMGGLVGAWAIVDLILAFRRGEARRALAYVIVLALAWLYFRAVRDADQHGLWADAKPFVLALADKGIRVNAVGPGTIATELAAAAARAPAGAKPAAWMLRRARADGHALAQALNR